MAKKKATTKQAVASKSSPGKKKAVFKKTAGNKSAPKKAVQVKSKAPEPATKTKSATPTKTAGTGVAKKASSKKSPVKTAVRKSAPAKKVAVVKQPAKKAAPVKQPAKKAAAVKQPAKKAAAVKQPAKKADPAKKIAKKAAIKTTAPATTARKSPTSKKQAVAVKKSVAAAPAPPPPTPKVTKKPAVKADQAPKSQPPARPKKKAAPLKPPYPKSGAFVRSQHQKMLDLRDSLLDLVQGNTRENLRNRSDGNDASAFGMHQADAGSDAYDRDFALNMLNQEQDALYEINEAIHRIDKNVYGICEMSGQTIPKERLEYLPWARHTVAVQSKLEKEQGYGRQPRYSRFSMNMDDDDED